MSLLSPEADVFRLYLQRYPAAAGTVGGVGPEYHMTPYHLGKEMTLSLLPFFQYILTILCCQSLM